METKFQKGALVWAKLSGHPWWPAIIKTEIDSNKYEVEYFGDFSRSYLHSSKLKKFDACLELKDRRNQGLANSFEMAMRVRSGISTVEEERLRVESQPEGESQSNRNKSHGNESDQSLDMADNQLFLKHNKSTPNLEIRRETKRRAEPKAKEALPTEEIFYDEPEQSSDGSKRVKRIKKRESQESAKLTSEKPHSAKISLDERRFEMTQAKDTKSIIDDDLTGQIDVELERIKAFEDRLRAISTMFSHPNPRFEDIKSALVAVKESLSNDETSIHRMYHTEIGMYLGRIQSELLRLQQVDRRFAEMSELAFSILKLVRKKLFVEFFKTQDFDQKVIYSSFEMENQISQGRPAVSAPKFINDNNDAKRKSLFHQNAVDSQSISKFKVEDPQKTKRVCKKIAKQLYSKLKTLKMKKQDCENMAVRVEKETRQQSKNTAEYDSKILEIVQKLKENSGKLLERLQQMKPTSMALKLIEIHSFLIAK